MGDSEDEQESTRVNPIFIFGVLLGIVGLWWAFQTEPAELAPGCRFVGKFQQCETPSPYETPGPGETPSEWHSPLTSPGPYDDDPFGP